MPKSVTKALLGFTTTTVSVQYNGGFLPDIILLTQCYYHRMGFVFSAIDPTYLVNVLTFFPSDWGLLRRSRCVLIFL